MIIGNSFIVEHVPSLTESKEPFAPPKDSPSIIKEIKGNDESPPAKEDTHQDFLEVSDDKTNKNGKIGNRATNEATRLRTQIDNAQEIWEQLEEKIKNLLDDRSHAVTRTEIESLTREIKQFEDQKNEVEERLSTLEAKLDGITESAQSSIKDGQKSTHHKAATKARIGLNEVTTIMREDPRAGSAISTYNSNFKQVRNQIDNLASYKDIHDQLHHLEFSCFNLLYYEIGQFPDKSNFDVLNSYRMIYQGIKDRVHQIVEKKPLPTDQRPLLEDLDSAGKLYIQAIDNRDLSTFRRSVEEIRHILAFYPPRFNIWLNNAASSLSLQYLQKDLEKLKGRLAQLEFDRTHISLIEIGIQGLAELSNSFKVFSS